MENEGHLEVKYTENAKKRLEELTNDYVKRMEFHLKRRKYRKGKNYIEVTTADLDNVARNYKYIHQGTTGFGVLHLYIVFVIGLLAIISGVLWKYMRLIVKGSDYIFLYTIIIGTILLFISLASFFYTKLDESEKKKERDKRHGRR